MSYSEPLSNQIRVFFLSVGVGVFICLLYIAVQSLFALFGKSNRVYYFADGVFSVLFAFVSFFFMVLYNSGRVRLHLILGEALGFFVFYFSVGRYLHSALERLTETIRKTVGIILLPVRSVLRHFLNGMGEIRDRFILLRHKKVEGSEAEEKKVKKFKFLGKIHLKNRNKSV